MEAEKSSTRSADESRNAGQRLADLAVFSNGIAHDLRNPLNVIRTNLYLLEQRLPGEDPRVARILERIEEQVTATTRYLEGIQALSRADHAQPQRLDLNQVVQSVVDSTPLPETHALQVELEAGGAPR